ncbi:MAG: hypothetical protein Q6360_09185, partial [Candidatus Brocadiales bacterium]|nr:hypothetical protein [Candidatus Brocadiales bacterium]
NRYFGRIPGLSASVLFYSIPIVSLHMHTVLVDIGLSFFIFLSVYFMVDWICSHGGRKSLILSALFCAFAVGTKPYAIISAAALCVLVFWKLFRTDKYSGTISFLKAAAFGVASASGYLPWALINFYYTNNPFYPYFNKYFRGPYALEQFISPISDYKLNISYLPFVGITSMPIIFFKALWEISFDGNTYSGIIGPFFVLLLPILTFVGAKKLDAAIKQFLWFSLINFILWFPFIYNVRLMMPMYPALCIATVYIFQSFLTTTCQHNLSPLNTPLNPLLIEGRREGGVFFRSFIGTLLKSLTVLIIIIFAILNLPFFYNSWQHNPKRHSSPLHTFPLSYVLGLESKEKYLERFIRSYPVVQFTNNLPNVKTIFYIGGPETPFFYLKHKAADLVTYYVPKLAQLNDPEALLKALKEHSISHIIRDKHYKGKQREGIVTLLQNTNIDGVFANKYLRKIYEKDAFVLYEVLDKKKSFVNEYVHYYFLDHTVDAMVLRSSKEQLKKEDYKDILEINGNKRCALKTLPPSKIQFTSIVPNDAFITFSIGKLLPDIGDGGTFTLNLVDQYRKTHDLFRKTLNPRDNYSDGGWHYNEIDLSQFRGQKVDFMFGSDISNSLDETGDWFAWADPQIVVRPEALNLTEHLPEARMTPSSCEDTPNGKPAFLFPFERGGDTRNTITTVAPSEITFTVNIPAENPSLIFGLAMPYQLGDGALAEIFFDTDGKTECIYSKYIYPAPEDKHQDNGWIDEIISLDKFTGKNGKLTFRSSPGPAGDSTADWIGWSEPRIVTVKQLMAIDK